MRSFQDKLLGELAHIAEVFDLDVVKEPQWANTGRVLAQDGFTTVASFTYDFQNGGKHKILINGAQHGPPGIDTYWIEATDAERIGDLLTRWRNLCRGYE